ncbi:MAG: hypothetical protein P8J74_02420 [Woeseiaceae bacterium]|nr:hypothetical protein [Woeseiaceae bacterium]
MNKISTILVSGTDAFDFLQNQLTNDLKRLESVSKILAAWCNPKGRVIWFGSVLLTESNFKLSTPTDLAENIVQRLSIFRFRAKVDFKIIDEDITMDTAALIRKGHPIIGLKQSEQYTPHMLNLDLLDAIDFEKGCYTGQEVIARTHYKGMTKRRTLKFESNAPVSPGDKVSHDGQNIGNVLNVSGSSLLAVVPIKKADKELSVNNSKLHLASLPYLDKTTILA